MLNTITTAELHRRYAVRKRIHITRRHIPHICAYACGSVASRNDVEKSFIIV